MDFLEKDLEQVIYDATVEQLEILNLRGKRFRQLRIGNFGIADLVFFDRDYTYDIEFTDEKGYFEVVKERGLRIVVCELKKDKIGISVFLQAIKYCKGIKTYLQKRGFKNFYFEILLMGKDLDISGSFPYLADLFTNNNDEMRFSNSILDISFYTYKYEFDGIKFEIHKDYNLINKGF